MKKKFFEKYDYIKREKAIKNLPAESRFFQHYHIIVKNKEGFSSTIPETWESLGKVENMDSKYYLITAGTAYRPDLIAYFCFRNEKLWWWLMYSNNIIDIYDLYAGRTLKIIKEPIYASHIDKIKGDFS